MKFQPIKLSLFKYFCIMTVNNQQNLFAAQDRIKNFLHRTPLLYSEMLSHHLGHNIFFKVDSLQKTGAFKVRGVLNHLLKMQEENILPSKIVAYSSGNHGIGLAWAAGKLGIKSRIYLPNYTAPVKQQAAKYYGAEVIYTITRTEAEKRAFEDQKDGYYFLHPSDHDDIIYGAASLTLEALQDIPQKPDAIFASIGGGGLISGAYLAKELLAPEAELIGSEPVKANDAFLSKQQQKIISLSNSPSTIADGLKTLRISERTFEYIKKIDRIELVKESEIYSWTAWLLHLIKVACEPSCAINMEAVSKWAKIHKPNPVSRKNILVLISGGNIDPLVWRELWKEDYLTNLPWEEKSY